MVKNLMFSAAQQMSLGLINQEECGERYM